MLKKIFLSLSVTFALANGSIAQTDSTDLDLSMSTAVLVTELDSMLYSGENYQLLSLEFTISDTASFGKVHVELTEVGAPGTLFIGSYTQSQLSAAGFIEAWAVNIPFGILLDTQPYLVSITLEDYSGALTATITKTLVP
jgi:hypothetical protein